MKTQEERELSIQKLREKAEAAEEAEEAKADPVVITYPDPEPNSIHIATGSGMLTYQDQARAAGVYGQVSLADLEAAMSAAPRRSPMIFPTSMRPYVALTPETEAILGRLLNPTTTLERLCVAALRGDAVALAALADGIKQGELEL